MAVALPTLTKASTFSQRLIDFGAKLTPTLGGPSQYIGRLGNRFAVDVHTPPLDQVGASALLAARIAAVTAADTVTLSWPQPAFEGALGTPQVDGAGQLGSTLNAKAMTVGAVIPAFTFFSFVAGGRHYLHVTTEEATVDGAGKAALPIGPLLRASPANNAALEFAAPVIEGLLDDSTVAWTLERLRAYGTSFTLVENQ